MKKTTLILIFLGVVLMTAGTTAAVVAYNNSTRRGIRNNNPGNLTRSNIQWKGKVPHSRNKDSHFEQFEDFQGVPGYIWGLRAMFIDLRGDVEKDGMNTPRKLITTYAPPTGIDPTTGKTYTQNTKGYIDAVSKALGITPDTPIAKTAYLPLMKAIIKHENIEQPYPDAVIHRAMTTA